MEKKIAHYLQTILFCPPQKRLLVAISGGIDSVVLLHLLHSLGYKQIKVLHVNFGLRGEESAGDEAFVVTLAKQYGYAYEVKAIDLATYQMENGASIQMAARDLRYQWFEELRQKEKYDYILTAHHQNDKIETFFLNLIRGTGIAGLQALKPKQGCLLRPLLSVNRQEIQQYAAENGLSWREDSSNASNKYKRNLLRNEIIPLMRKMNPNLEETFAQTLEKLDYVGTIFWDETTKLEKQILTQKEDGWYLVLDALVDAPHRIVQLYEIVRRFGFSYDQCKRMLQEKKMQTGKKMISHTHVALYDRKRWMIAPIEQWQEIPETPRLEYIAQPPYTQLSSLPQSNRIAHFDLQKLELPLQLRIWQAGDWFCPLGMAGKRKKISDLLIDQKLTTLEKQQIWVLTSADTIVWVVGLRIDERYKVEKNTQQIYTVAWI